MTTPNKINFPAAEAANRLRLSPSSGSGLSICKAPCWKPCGTWTLPSWTSSLPSTFPLGRLGDPCAVRLCGRNCCLLCPAVLEKNPYLLGYYRLLMGYSQKEFYGRDKGFGVGHFKGDGGKGQDQQGGSR
jgi:hypothetical protein